MNVTGSEINFPRYFIPCKNLKLAAATMDSSASGPQLCKSMDSDFEKLNLHHLNSSESCGQMDIEIKSEPGVNMRLKKQRVDSQDDLTKERPMSWEGETEMFQHCDIKKDCGPASPMQAITDGQVQNDINSNHQVPSDLSIPPVISPQHGRSPSAASLSSLGGARTACDSPLSHQLPKRSNSSCNIANHPLSSQSPSPILAHRPTSSSSSSYSPSPSPQQGRHIQPEMSPSQISLTNSPIHTRYTSSDGSIYSPTQSPLQARHPFCDQPPVFSPHQSPIQPRHKSDSPGQSPQLNRQQQQQHFPPYSYAIPAQGLPPGAMPPMFAFCYPPSEHSGSESKDTSTGTSPQMSPIMQARMHDVKSNASSTSDDRPGSSGSRHSVNSLGSLDHPDLSQSVQTSGISRQQLINSPCPICGDKISGFHYGIFSCESCKGFFKRTVQNKKNYVCLRGASCPVTISTRKKCPACRFEKCLRKGMKLEAIREDRTRGGRSTYQCTYSIPGQAGLADYRGTPNCPPSATPSETSSLGSSISGVSDKFHFNGHSNSVSPTNLSMNQQSVPSSSSSGSPTEMPVPSLINEILAVEHLWHHNTTEGNKSDQQYNRSPPARMMASLSNAQNDTQFFANLCNIADYRLYKIVKWCKSLPLFKDIVIDDQISLLINAWCELLVLSCCYRSISTPNEIRISQGKSVTLEQAQLLGLGTVIERMLNITDHFRRLKFDECEYVCLKVIILLTSDVTMLKEPHKVQHCQEQVLHAMQTYTSSHYPQTPSKFGETLLRIPDLERTCQIGKETLFKHRSGDMPSFNLLVELLRGEH